MKSLVSPSSSRRASSSSSVIVLLEPLVLGEHAPRDRRPVGARSATQRDLELRADRRDRAAQLVRRVRDELALPRRGLLEPVEHRVHRVGRAARPRRRSPARARGGGSCEPVIAAASARIDLDRSERAPGEPPRQPADQQHEDRHAEQQRVGDVARRAVDLGERPFRDERDAPVRPWTVSTRRARNRRGRSDDGFRRATPGTPGQVVEPAVRPEDLVPARRSPDPVHREAGRSRLGVPLAICAAIASSCSRSVCGSRPRDCRGRVRTSTNDAAPSATANTPAATERDAPPHRDVPHQSPTGSSSVRLGA